MSNKIDDYWAERFGDLGRRIEKHEKKIAGILSGALNNPQRSTAFWNKVRAEIKAEYKKIGVLFNEWSKVEIPKAYKYYMSKQFAHIKRLKSITNKAKLSLNKLVNTNASKQIVSALYLDAISDMATGLAAGNVRINRLTRITQQTLIDEFLVDSAVADAFTAGSINISTILKRRGTLANQLLTQAKNGRFLTIIDKNGNPRSYRIKYYAEMVTRVKFHEAQAQAAIVTAANYDADLVRVSDHNTTTEICQQYEGKIFSLSGKDKRFPVLDQTPPFHVNCLHYLMVTFEESLQAQGKLKEFSDFSLGKTETHPTNNSFIPVSERMAA